MADRPAGLATVPLSQPVAGGTVRQATRVRDGARDTSGPPTLKALALRALGRDTAWDAQRDRAPRDCLSVSQSGPEAWDAVDWLAYFDERAGIAEHCGGVARARAERMAGEACVVEWLRQHPPHTDPASCAFCGASARHQGSDILVLADGAAVHVRCHGAYVARRRSEAEYALAVLGVSQ